MSNEADDLWIGHKMQRDNPLSLQGAMVLTSSEFIDACEDRDTGRVRKSARWLRSIADAMEELADQHDFYEKNKR